MSAGGKPQVTLSRVHIGYLDSPTSDLWWFKVSPEGEEVPISADGVDLRIQGAEEGPAAKFAKQERPAPKRRISN